ncbi:hypothetical protein PR048_004243 [Dryococelus australis]|uniref:Uncharacterized protein n=1 Tax=Dryococelus australis TaxID=614101 RepID=A0ABQ9I639_9NEOP|nr:hypothetical protein PR048_004243 [Dryococelus australis]
MHGDLPFPPPLHSGATQLNSNPANHARLKATADKALNREHMTRPGIKPSSPWWEASRLTAQPPRSQLRNNRGALSISDPASGVPPLAAPQERCIFAVDILHTHRVCKPIPCIRSADLGDVGDLVAGVVLGDGDRASPPQPAQRHLEAAQRPLSEVLPAPGARRRPARAHARGIPHVGGRHLHTELLPSPPRTRAHKQSPHPQDTNRSVQPPSQAAEVALRRPRLGVCCRGERRGVAQVSRAQSRGGARQVEREFSEEGSGNLAGRCRWSAGFSLGFPVSPTLSFRLCSILISITIVGSQDLAVKSSPNLFTHSVPSLILYTLEPASFLRWLLYSCEATPFLNELHVIGVHSCEAFIYRCRVTQGASNKVWSNDKHVAKDKPDFKHMNISLIFTIGSQFVRHARKKSEPITDLQVNKHVIMCHLF